MEANHNATLLCEVSLIEFGTEQKSKRKKKEVVWNLINGKLTLPNFAKLPSLNSEETRKANQMLLVGET